jgi:hypothetical protein
MCLFLLREFDAETVAQAFAKGQGTVTWFVPDHEPAHYRFRSGAESSIARLR